MCRNFGLHVVCAVNLRTPLADQELAPRWCLLVASVSVLSFFFTMVLFLLRLTGKCRSVL